MHVARAKLHIVNIYWITDGFQVAPLEYLRHVTMDIGGGAEAIGSDPSSSQLGISVLIDRFNEVSSFDKASPLRVLHISSEIGTLCGATRLFVTTGGPYLKPCHNCSIIVDSSINLQIIYIIK